MLHANLQALIPCPPLLPRPQFSFLELSEVIIQLGGICFLCFSQAHLVLLRVRKIKQNDNVILYKIDK